MGFWTSSFYTEPGYYFDISYKVFALIERKVAEEVGATGFQGIKDGETLSLMINTSSSQETMEVRGPDIDRKNKVIVYCVWLPYRPIANSDNLLKAFLTNYFDGLAQLLVKYGVDERKVRKIQFELEAEVLENDDYIFDEEPTPDIDLSDLNL